MLDHTTAGGFANPPVDAARVFRAALTAMARPGRIGTVAPVAGPAPLSPAAAALILVLCDGETPLCLGAAHDTPNLREWIAFHTGAPIVAPGEAMFALGLWQDLQPLTAYRIGTPEYPDRSATLIVEVESLDTDGATLTGPGIETVAHLSLPETDAFRANRALFPLGLDFYFTAQDRLAGLPRSTFVEAG